MRYFIVIPLEPVTKKNSQRVVKNRQTGAHFIIPSLKFERYQKDVGSYFTYQKIKPIEPEFYPVNIRCNFYMRTNRLVDLTNLLEAVDDVLTHCGVIVNDDYKHVAGHDGSRVFVDKDYPRTEIFIEPLYCLWSRDFSKAGKLWKCTEHGNVLTNLPKYCPTCGRLVTIGARAPQDTIKGGD